jgi:chemotaxis protein histidine kinase CheA
VNAKVTLTWACLIKYDRYREGVIMALDQADIVKYKGLYLQTAKAYVTDMQRNITLMISGSEHPETAGVIHIAAHSLTTQSLLMNYIHIGNAASLFEKIFKAKIDGAFTMQSTILSSIDLLLKKMQNSLFEIEKNNTEIDLSGDIKQLEDISGIKAERGK